MPAITLTAYDGAILGPIARVLGWLMDGIYIVMYRLFGIENIGLSIVLLTILIYTCLLPLTYRQQKFSKMNAIMQPEINAIREKYKNRNDQDSMMAMNQETKLVYEKYGVSQSGSCISLLIQMPILFALYRVFYNTPAYITMVHEQFEALAEGIAANSDYVAKMSDLVSDFSVSVTTNPDWTSSGETLTNYIIDVIYKLSSSGWESLTSYFPTLEAEISDALDGMHNFNYIFGIGSFQGLNISDSPFYIIRTYFSQGQYLYVVLALLIPIASYVSQVLSIKMSQQSQQTGDPQADQMANQMKTMNTIMPLFSLILCFTVPVGLGIYWVFSAVYRCIQQFALNRYFEKVGMEKLVEREKEKAKKKREKKGISDEKIRQAAQINTRNIESRANVKTNADKEKDLQKATEKKANARPGSMAAKANMVKDFNERNSRK